MWGEDIILPTTPWKPHVSLSLYTIGQNNHSKHRIKRKVCQWICSHGFKAPPPPFLLWLFHAHHSGRSFPPILDSAALTHKEMDSIMTPQMWDEAKKTVKSHFMPILDSHIKQCIYSLCTVESSKSYFIFILQWKFGMNCGHFNYMSVSGMQPLDKPRALCTCLNSIRIQNII